MADKESRKRKKQRKDSAKKVSFTEETDDSSPPRELKAKKEKKAPVEEDHGHSHGCSDPSSFAKIVFFMLFTVLLGAAGYIVFTLPSADRESLDLWWEGKLLQDEQAHHDEGEIHLPPVEEEVDQAAHEDDVSLEEVAESTIETAETTIEDLSEQIEGSIVYDPSDLHPWAEHQEPEKKETNFDHLYDDDDQSDTDTDNVSIDLEQQDLLSNFAADLQKMLSDNQILGETDDVLEALQESITDAIKEDIVLNDMPADDDSLLDIQELQDEVLEEQFVPEIDADEPQIDQNELRIERGDQTADDINMEDQNVGAEEPTMDQNQLNADQNQLNADQNQLNADENPQPVIEDVIIEEKYEQEDITNDYDFLFRDELDNADRIVEKHPEKALNLFESLLKRNPESVRALYGKATALDKMADIEKNNKLLEKAIELYKEVMTYPTIKDALYLIAGARCVNRLQFRGLVGKALAIQSLIAIKFPDNLQVQNQLAVSYLMFGRGPDAKKILIDVLSKYPNSGFAKVHLGFILKTEDKLYPDAIKYLSEGIATKEKGVVDGRFYFHLGDALSRTGQSEKALEVYEDGVKEGLFFSALQRSLYNVDGLKAQPWWEIGETTYENQIKKLEQNWLLIRDEALSLMTDKGFEPENEGLQDTGDWQQFNLFLRGRRVERNCKLAPKTCSLIDKSPEAANCKRGQAKFSIMQPGTHVWAHTGPTNCRLRSHLGLVVPPGARMRVGNVTKGWTEGKVIVFDDSFEHEVWHDGKTFRLVLIVDFWHPGLTIRQKNSLSPL